MVSTPHLPNVRSLLLAAALLAGLASTPLTAQSFEVIWEPTSPGGLAPGAISPNGDHVLFTSPDPNLGNVTFVWSKDTGVKSYGRIQQVDETISTNEILPWVVSDDGRPAATGVAAVRPGDGQAWMQAYAWVDGTFSLIEVEGHAHSSSFPQSIGLGLSTDGSAFTGRMRFPNDGSGQFPNDGSTRYYLSKDGSAALFPDPPVGVKFHTAGPESMTADGEMVIGKICNLFGQDCEVAIWNGSEYILAGRSAGAGELGGLGVISRTGTAAVFPDIDGSGQWALWTGCPIVDAENIESLPTLMTAVSKVRADGALLFASPPSSSVGGIWTPGTGLMSYEEAMEEFGILPEGWTLLSVSDVSDDGRVWTGAGRAPDGIVKLWRATLPPASLPAGKRPLECACSVEDLTYSGPDPGSLKASFNWNTGTTPGSGDNLILPLLDDPYTVLGSEAYGALTIDGDVTLRNEVPDVPIELNGLCPVSAGLGNALMLRGRFQSPGGPPTLGSRLEIVESRAVVNGNIFVPSSPDTYADLLLTDAGLESDRPILVFVGAIGAGEGNVHLKAGSDWQTSAATAEVGTGAVTLEDASSMVIQDLLLSTTPGDRPLNALLDVTSASTLRVDSLAAGVENNAWIILNGSDTQIEARAFEAGMGGEALVELGSEAELSVTRGVLGKRDTAEVSVRGGASILASERLALGSEPDGVGRLAVESRGALGLGLLGTNVVVVGGEGVGIMDVSEDAAAAASRLILGEGKSGEGILEVRGSAEDQELSLGTALMVVGKEGDGTVLLFDAKYDADFDLVKGDDDVGTIILGEARGGSGTLALFGASDVSVFTLIAGQEGRGEVDVDDTSDLDATRIILGGSGVEAPAGTFPEGVMTVAREATVIAGESICVGCPDGSGLLDVEGFVQTNILQVGLNGTVTGTVVNVQTVSPGGNKRLAEEGILTEALFLAAGATVEVDSLVIGNGTLGGTITWPDAYTNAGTLSPGDGPGAAGTFTFGSAYTQAPEGALVVDLGGLAPGDEHDVLAVQGAAVLAGTLRIRRIGDYVPARGDRYRIVAASEMTGTFASVVAEDLGVAVSYEADGVWVEVVSSVDVEAGREGIDVPAAFALEANYPNPFNPRTTIGYTLAESAHVTVRVYDLYGRLMGTLVDGRQAAGRHAVAFDASGLASGTYFYRIEAGAFAAQRLMMLVK